MKTEYIVPYTKKCSAKIYQKVASLDSGAKKTTTYDQAWVILATAYNWEGQMESKLDSSRFILYKDDEAVHEFKWDNPMWDTKEGDWLWTDIYKEVIEWAITHRMLSVKKRKVKTKEAIKEEEDKPIIEEPVETIDDLKKKLQRLSVKKSGYKKSGKDISEIEKEITEIKSKIETLKSK